MSDSYIVVRENGRASAFVGPDATELVRASVLISGLRMWARTGGKIILTRGMSSKKLLALAKRYTGKDYKRGECERAAADVQLWVDTMKAALPVVQR